MPNETGQDRIAVVRVELFPDLSHCVQTQAKKEHSETMKKLLAAEGQSEELEERLELLRLFLEEADFKDLRRESEKHLAQGRQVKFTVYLEDGRPRWDLQAL
jgi:hypothetical protein